MNIEDLKKPFSVNDIEWRVQQSGMTNGKPWAMVLAYVTNRAIQNRLDAVCGADKWKNDFVAGPQGGVLCGVSIKINDEWITKWDGADNTKIESIKGGLSDSMKRAAVQWGIGRYLYNLHEGWAKFVKDGCYKCKIENKWYEWNPPALLPEFLPEHERTKKKQEQEQQTAPQTDPLPNEFLKELDGFVRSLQKCKSVDEIEQWKKTHSKEVKALPENLQQDFCDIAKRHKAKLPERIADK